MVEANTGSLCMRMYKRADGTVLTADCPVGEKDKKKKVRRLSMVAAGVAAGLAAFAGVAVAQSSADTGKLTAVDEDEDEPTKKPLRPEHVVMGAMPAPTVVPSASPPPPKPVLTAEPEMMMGDIAPSRLPDAPAIDPSSKTK